MPKGLAQYLGVNPEAYAQAASAGERALAAKAKTASNNATVAALTNQTGGNILGFTYE